LSKILFEGKSLSIEANIPISKNRGEVEKWRSGEEVLGKRVGFGVSSAERFRLRRQNSHDLSTHQHINRSAELTPKPISTST
jgi:hypothetical protein